MREKELLELLCQYETEEKFNCVPTAMDWFEVINNNNNNNN